MDGAEALRGDVMKAVTPLLKSKSWNHSNNSGNIIGSVMCQSLT
ncbi:hypothetical protein C7476_12221 [Phyllobacterium bourgognense]|uniref:Uncharacterized protein n=1 Tax=Phyllobacterium bourgognense TaxID=314236 RepID=A0A368YGD9_9HYPH|nr:hypothetical protein C7476_12221 [Phyllobacterium bourgognense]